VYIPMTPRDIMALIEAVKLSEEVKPAQQAKRDAFAKYGIQSGFKDRVLTAIYYDTLKRTGVLDRIIAQVIGFQHVRLLDPWLRAALRVAVELLHFERFVKEQDPVVRNTMYHYVKRAGSRILMRNVSSFAAAFFHEAVEKIANFRYNPQDLYARWELRYLVSEFIIRKLAEMIGKRETKEFLRAINRVPPISLRVNTLKASVEEVVEELKKEGAQVLGVGKYVPTVVKIKGPFSFEKSKLYHEGKIVIQDEASALASILLDPKPGETVVDMCAAPGGKTEHMAELMRNEGVIHAFDVDERRLKRMEDLLRRAGISIVKVYRKDVRKAPQILGEGIADRVLLDAPCTSSGTLAKNHDLRWKITEVSLRRLAERQKQLMEVAVRLAKPGGRILYTVCSIFREEGEDVIKYVLDKYPDKLRLIELKGPFDPGFLPGTMRAWPHRHGTNGFFYALLERVA